MRSILAALLGAALAVNGLYMLGAPGSWYETVPGVADSGPLNPHFVRDIGGMYLLAGAAFLWLARSAMARGSAFLGACFLAIHGLVHFGEAIATGHWSHLLGELPGVFVPAALALWLTLTPPTPRTAAKAKERHHASLADQALHRGL